MTDGFDRIHDYKHRMDLAIARLKANEKVSLLNRFKIFRFLDCLETKQMALPRRMRYLVDPTTFASMLYDSGGRPGEILNLQWKNINFDQQGAVVVVDGKTGQHRERLIVSVSFAAEWMNDHPSKTPTLWKNSWQRTSGTRRGRGCSVFCVPLLGIQDRRVVIAQTFSMPGRSDISRTPARP